MNGRKIFNVVDNDLYIGGISAKNLAEKYGTPLYVMDKGRIEEMCEVYSKTLNKEYGLGKVFYASKAFCCKDIYRTIKQYNLGADAVSLGEMMTAKAAGFNLKDLILHGNNKSEEELTFAVKNNVKYVVIDSLRDCDLLNEICKNNKTKQEVLIRVNPGVEAHTHKFIQTATVDSKFGFSVSNGDADKIINYVLGMPYLTLKGLHCHIGSQIFETQSFLVAIDKMTEYYSVLNKKGIVLDVLNLGGGIGVWYNKKDKESSYKDYQFFIKTICEKVKENVLKHSIKKPFLILEPGRSIVAEAGVTLYKIGNVKEIPNVKNYIAIDGGMFENPRFALYDAKYTVDIANKINDKNVKKYTIAGKCCESGDIIAKDCMLPTAEVNDILAVYTTGAYNYSMASNYNRNLIPAVVMVKDGKDYIAVKRQSYDNLLDNDL